MDSYYLDSQIKDDFQCTNDCYLQHRDSTIDNHSNTCTHDYHHITQSVQDLSDSTQQNTLHSIEENASLFADDTATHCNFNIIGQNSDTENANDTNMHFMPEQPGIHSHHKHAYRNTFGESNIQYHDFDNQDSLTFTDKYTALLQKELQNPYWNLHDPIMTKCYQISKDMDIETMPHAMYFTGDLDIITKINHVPYQTIEYNDNGMFTAKLMNDTPIKIFIDNGATPSILPLHTYNKFPILHTYPKTESNTPIHTGRGLIKSHFWLEIPLQLQHQTIQIKAFDARSKGLVQTNNLKHFPIDQYLHDRMTPATLSPTPLAYEKPIHPAEMPCITTCKKLPVDDMNKSTSDDRYPWLEPDDIGRNTMDKEILRMKLNLKDSVLDEKGKEEFLEKVKQFMDVFSLRDEIGTCPFIEVHLKLKDETPFFVRPYPMREGQKKVIQKEMDRLEHLGIIHKGLTGYSSLVVLVKWKNQNLYRVCSDFCILNEKLVKINHAFPLVRDCIQQLGRKKCHYLSTIDLRDAFHALCLALSSQKYCSITPYYGSPTYHYLCMGMGMSVSPQIWQQFIDLVSQDDLIKCKQNFYVIMDDTFIHSTAEEHMDDLMDLLKVLRKYGLKLSPHKCQFFKKKIVYMGLEFQVQGDKVCYTPLKDKCNAIGNLESPKTLRKTRTFCRMVNFLSSFLPNLCRLLIQIYDLQKKAKKFKWTDEAKKALNEIKKLLISPPVLKAPTPDGLF